MELEHKKRAATQQEMYDQWTSPKPKTNEEYLAEIRNESIEPSAPQHTWPRPLPGHQLTGQYYHLGVKSPVSSSMEQSLLDEKDQ